ncbi:acid phosphatase 1-like [Chenopodium quinoa]|uniref:acid phosphatase 1-like n=1 Tax=Chenopodium quinoa TaxID=63459 RepID=UPI000B76F959|nr:acid phosphatase 1-like [Chenopodium quinoa]
MMHPPTNLIILELLLFTYLFVTPSQTLSQPIHVPLPTATKLYNHNRNHDHESSLFCETWRFSVETNNAGNWSSVPVRCYKYVMDYMTGDRYALDFGLAAKNALEYARSVDIAGDKMDAWIFDVDETLLSTFPYYKLHGFGKKNRTEFIKWGLGKGTKLPVLKASLRLYKELRKLGFKIFLLTGRPEWIRNSSVANLMDVGYSDWERLILRQPSDENKTAIDYKSENRKKLEDEGYRIHGNSGDQWSDLLGYAISQRSFKYPNPMYYVA